MCQILKKKRKKSFSNEEKVKLIRCIQSGINLLEICKNFKLSKSTFSNIWKSSNVIIAVYKKKLNGAKKLYWAGKENIEKALFKWFTIQQN